MRGGILGDDAKRNFIVLFLVLSVLLSGCAKQAVEETSPIEETPVQEEVAVVPEPEEPTVEEVKEAPVEDEKQLSLGTTDMKEEELSIISGVECVFGPDGPEKFLFKMTNTEEKKWEFRSLSYTARETSDNPVVILNALQVTNSQLIEGCGKRYVQPGATVVCDFNLDSVTNAVMRHSMRTGLTGLGNENKNTLSLKTAGHAAEIVFLCE